MNRKKNWIARPCDCGCCMFVVERTLGENGEADYNISIQDSRYDHNHNTLWGRIMRATKILLGKPIYYNDVFIEGEAAFENLLQDMKCLQAKTD